jgi:hypothetical protein
LAERRRAFARALRVPVGFDASAVVVLVTGSGHLDRPGERGEPTGGTGVNSVVQPPTEGEKNAMSPR